MAGRGSVENRGKGSWRLTVSLGIGKDGKYKKKQKTVRARNKTEARSLLNEFILELEAGEYIDPSKMRLVDFSSEWRDKYAVKHLSPNTLDTYQFILNAHLLSEFGHMRLDEVKPIHIMNYLNNLENVRKDGKDGGLSSSSIQYHHRVLKNIFSRACEWKLIKTNPVESGRRWNKAKRMFIPLRKYKNFLSCSRKNQFIRG